MTHQARYDNITPKGGFRREPRAFSQLSFRPCINTFHGYCAFLPHPLPPRLEYDDKLIYLLSEATKLLGELSGTGRLLPNPHLLINPYIKREAVSSSRIEGTQASLNELFFFEAAETEEPEIPDVKEIANYVRALEFGLDLQKQLPVSVRMIKKYIPFCWKE